MPQSHLSGAVRKNLLLKVLAKIKPGKEDIDSVIELTASKVVETLEAQSMTLYLMEGNDITFKYVYYSPTLWAGDAAKEQQFEKTRETLLSRKLPKGSGIVGKVIESGESSFFAKGSNGEDEMFDLSKYTGFEVSSMITVPLKGSKVIGAIQVLNKEPHASEKVFRESEMATIQEVAEYSGPLMQRMLDPGYQISDIDTARFVSRFTGSPLVTDTSNMQIDENLLEVVGADIIRRDGILPYKRLSPTAVAVLMTNPFDFPKRDAFQSATELHIEEVSVAPMSLIEEMLTAQFGKQEQQAAEEPPDTELGELADVLGEEYAPSADGSVKDGDFEDEESAPVIQLATRIVEDAYICGASDIHIEPMEHELLVRYRVDGVCAEKLRLPKTVTGALCARYKVMADLDIAEKRLPQDGRIVFKRFTRRNMNIDLRVATAPQNFGEKIVMRILDKSKSTLPITALGFSEENLGKYRDCIQQPYGMILHCGPTGSGKSMTLFSALQEIANPEINIQTAEDPIEYTLAGINQMQMKKEIGLDFARALRSFLRMDPDVILVGEIRDTETAAIAVEAALTGHLLLSTLHTNDAPSTVARFTDMGIEPFMISASLLIVCAQRLMRRVCKNCKEQYDPEGREKALLEAALDGWSGEIFRAREGGCEVCGGKGYKGRVGIHELMRTSEELIAAINAEKETADIKRIAMGDGMKTLHQDSLLKVKQNFSTILEALATVPPDILKTESGTVKTAGA